VIRAEPATASVKFAYCLKFLEISRNLSNGLPPIRHTFRRTNALTIGPKGGEFALICCNGWERHLRPSMLSTGRLAWPRTRLCGSSFSKGGADFFLLALSISSNQNTVAASR
jgi:hypothetical protein